MLLDLSSLHSAVVEEIPINTKVSFPKEMLENSDILALNDIQVTGYIKINSSMEDEIHLEVNGNMLLEDSISLEEIEYPFSFEIDKILEENDKKDENTLDIMNILWENIVLEIPLKFTKVQDLSKFHGDGWKLVSEEEIKDHQNPFSDLLKEYGEE